jgi:hypothetical protein
VEGRQGIYEPKKRMVRDSEPEEAINLLDDSNLAIIQRKGLLQVLGGMDSLGIHYGNFWE